MSRASRVWVTGPLAPWAAGFAAWLVELGYTPSSAEGQLRLLAHLSGWLADQGLAVGELTPETVERFLRARCKGYVRLLSPRALSPLLGYLRRLELVPGPEPEMVATPVERLLADYGDYLARERGLTAGSVRHHQRVARRFLSGQPEPLKLALKRLAAGEVTAFVLAECRADGRAVASAKNRVSGLRSFLRFLHLAGWVSVPLAAAVPSVAGWRLSSLPRALEREQVARLLAGCDRATAVGRRDFAILVLLSRLGLRAHEIAALTLDDVDWRAGELLIRGKGGRLEPLPLPHDVGEPLVDYLRHGRPRAACRNLFLRACAPRVALSASGVRAVVYHACDQAGLPRVGAHRLRHTLASELLRSRRAAAGDRAGPAPREYRDDRDLREGRPGSAAAAGAAVADRGRCGVSTIRDAAADYLALRRGLGYKLETQGQVLAGFVGYLEQTGAATVTIEAAVAWATQPADADPVWWSNKLSVARGFARYLQTIDSSTEVPPAQLLPKRSRRATPYLYAPAEVAALIAAAGALALPLKAATYQTLIGLLAVSGMRVGAAVRLDRDHVDFEQGLLRIIKSKFGKSRELPLHPSTVQALTAYARQRDRLCPQPTASSFFVSTAGNRLHPASVRSTFARLVEAVGLQPRSPRCRPRLHDLRHSFAVATLLDWYRAGVDVQARLPVLSTYLGHAGPTATYWYLQAAPELLTLAARRLEQTAEVQLP